jgi:hypothetical protein
MVGMTGCAAGGEVPGQPSRATDGDCLARVRFDGAIYRPAGSLKPQAPTGSALGHGALIDCLGEPVGDGVVSRYRVHVFAVRGTAPTVAILVLTGDARGVYVAEALPRSQWPSFIRH